MSSYLLLRDNKESGPFTIEEIRGQSLKAYDLIWVVGKSAAWKYPGEIAELKAFAPPTPDSLISSIRRIAESTESNLLKKGTDTSKNRDTQSSRSRSSRAVYVNLPAEKKVSFLIPVQSVPDPGLLSDQLKKDDIPPEFLSDKNTSRSVKITGKLLWISTILLLFSTGILTGLFISDRRKFYSTHGEGMQVNATVPVRNPIIKNADPAGNSVKDHAGSGLITEINRDSLELKETGDSPKGTIVPPRQNRKVRTAKKDTAQSQVNVVPMLAMTDSSKQNNNNKTDLLFQKIKAHPEHYVSFVTGRFTTGFLGGISSFPVTVTNNSPAMMDLVVVNIDYIQNNGKTYKTESLSFNDLEPGETVTIKAPKSARGIKINTRIRVVNSRQLDLSYSN